MNRSTTKLLESQGLELIKIWDSEEASSDKFLLESLDPYLKLALEIDLRHKFSQDQALRDKIAYKCTVECISKEILS